MPSSWIHAEYRTNVASEQHPKSLPHWIAAVCFALYSLGGRWGIIRLIDPSLAAQSGDLYQYQIWWLIYETRMWAVLGALAMVPFVKHSWHRKCDAPVVLMLLFFFVFSISALWSPSEELALIKIVDIILLVLGCSLFAMYAGTLGFASRFLSASALILFCAMIMGLVAFARGTLDEEGTGRLSVLGGGPNTFGRLMGMLALIFGSYFSKNIASWKGYAAIVICSIAIFVLFLTGSRGALLATAAAICITLLCAGYGKKLTITAAIAGSILSITGPALVTYFDFGERFRERWIEQTERFYLSGRDSTFSTAFEVFLNNPIFGSGLNSFSIYSESGDLYAHNLFLETLQETGLLGFTLLFAYLCVVYSTLNIRASKLQPVLIGVFTLWLIGSMSSGDLYDSRNIFLFTILIMANSAQSSERLENHEVTGGIAP